MGFEGANVLFDSWVHPLVMGLEEHLLAMFRGDPEFHDEAGPSHLHHSPAAPAPAPEAAVSEDLWSSDAEAELRKIPFFVRGKARRNTEAFAAAEGLGRIELATLYEAKAHFGGR
jgi:light-independent protochlorophyllide reductase subunit B